jgi:hypothetical protein
MTLSAGSMGPPTSGRSETSQVFQEKTRHLLIRQEFVIITLNFYVARKSYHTLWSTHRLCIPESVCHFMLAGDCTSSTSTSHRKTRDCLHARACGSHSTPLSSDGCESLDVKVPDSKLSCLSNRGPRSNPLSFRRPRPQLYPLMIFSCSFSSFS